MNYGVYTSMHLQIAHSRYWTFCLYCNNEKSIIGAKLYNGTDSDKTLCAITERNMNEQKTVYAYVTPNGKLYTNDSNGVLQLIGESYGYSVDNMKQIDSIEISEQHEMCTVSEAGIKECLKQWRAGTIYYANDTGILFQLITGKIEYVCSIQVEKCNIYCGASVNIPVENGMIGSNQYFRLRNYADNTEPYCRFECNLGQDIQINKVQEVVCESGTCSITSQGLFWPLKHHTDHEIVLSGCGGEEYIYNRNNSKSEYFRV